MYACDHTKELIIKAHNNDKSAREKLVIDNSGLVWSIVKRFTGRGAEMEDLYQIGCIGLIKAIDNFNMDYDVKFSTYAVPMITDEVCLIDKLEGKDGGSDSIIDNIMINELVDSLCERDRKLIRMRYYEDMTQTQAARVLGISQVQVSRLEKKILNRMRSQIDIE